MLQSLFRTISHLYIYLQQCFVTTLLTHIVFTPKVVSLKLLTTHEYACHENNEIRSLFTSGVTSVQLKFKDVTFALNR